MSSSSFPSYSYFLPGFVTFILSHQSFLPESLCGAEHQQHSCLNREEREFLHFSHLSCSMRDRARAQVWDELHGIQIWFWFRFHEPQKWEHFSSEARTAALSLWDTITLLLEKARTAWVHTVILRSELCCITGEHVINFLLHDHWINIFQC